MNNSESNPTHIEVTNPDGFTHTITYLEVEEKWYRKNNTEMGNRQFIVMDPDGYLLRFTEDMGERDLV